MNPIDHPVSRYALSVVEGDVVAGELVRHACERHLLDLETGADRGLYFDCDAATRIVNYAGVLQHTTGAMAGKPFVLEPWQVFRHGSIFGWKRESDGLRRFRSTYHQVGKKNGKTTDTAVPMTYTQFLDGEAAPQGICAATNRGQASILFKEIKRMIKASPVLSRVMRPVGYEIRTDMTNGEVKALSRDSDGADGLNPHFVARDELHRWSDREMAEILANSMIARSQPIDWAITTAGADRRSICGELREYGESVVRGDVIDDSLFAYIAEPPADCDPGDRRAWMMGNPNLGVSTKIEDLQRIYDRACVIQHEMPNFRRLNLNLWTEGGQTWLARDVWDRGAQPFEMERLFGRKAYAAVDLSRTTDTTAIVVAVPVDGLIYLVSYTFLPAGPKGFIARAQAEKREYVSWRDMGWLEVHEGETIDQNQVIERIKWIAARFDLEEVVFDPWQMDRIAGELSAAGVSMVEHRQGYASMSAPMKVFEGAVLEGRLRHSGNPVLAWQVGNVAVDMDAAENIKPNKKTATGRIDAAVAAIMAVGRAEAHRENKRTREIAVV